MKSLHLFTSKGPRSTLADSSLRVEVCPPSLRHAPASLWERLLFWLLAPAPEQASPPLNRLPGVRADFLECTDDVHTARSDELRRRIKDARSLRELWHLRAEVYNAVAIQYNQHEAEQRLQRLNHHFPTRAPRDGLGHLSTP
jgi:hypothetical protein